MQTNPLIQFSKLLSERFNLSQDITDLLVTFFTILVIGLIAWLSDKLTKRILLQIVKRAVKRTKTTWDDVLLDSGVFKRLAHFAPAIIIHFSTHLIPEIYVKIIDTIQAGVQIYMLLVTLLAIDAFINALYIIYNKQPVAKSRNIKGYVQVVKILVYFAVIITILSVLLNRPLNNLLTGLGALAAVLILVFKDTILGLVASIQLSGNKMVNIGDWISMPKFNADGDVIDITLNTVKVQNWDKTISTIPTYALVSESFQNWKGMLDSGGRRIKRSINIDMRTVKFCTPEMIEKFRNFWVLEKYINEKFKVLDEYNKKYNVDDKILVNGRRMTNLGTFRAYIEQYLRNHPQISKELTFLVRHLQPTDKGLPIEIYVFSTDQNWVNYEGIQSDIFDHLLAVLPEFELSVFQSPSGEDLSKLNIK